MQKVTAFLEQHVQWVAIALGALFCLYMTYSYVILPPATAKIGNETLGPSEIDPNTRETVVTKLETAMQNSSRIKMDVPKYVQSFQDTMTWKNAKPVVLANMTDPSWTLDVTLPPPPQDPNNPNRTGPVPPGPGGVTPVPPGTELVAGTKLTQLPVPPTPKQTDPVTFVKYGRSVVVPAPAPGQAPQVPQPGIVPPGAVDTDWVTQMWTVSMPDIEQSFRAVGVDKLPAPELRKTMFLDVEMVREEQQPDGSWANATVITQHTPLRNNQPRQPFPGGQADPKLRQAQFQYAAWASTSTPDIIQPLFHVTVPGKGDQWTKPGAPVLAAVFDPNTFNGDLNTLTPEQRKAVFDARQLKHKQLMEQKKAAQPKTPRAPTGGGRPGPGGPGGGPGDESGMYAPRQRSYAPARSGGDDLPNFAVPPYPPQRGPYGPPQRGPYGPPRGFVPPDGGGEMDDGAFGGGYGGAGAAQAPNMPQPGNDFPVGDFDPTDPTPVPWKTKQVEIWQHDDQVQAGKTYRYKMRYRLKNPVFGASENAANPPSLTEQFSIDSEFSQWTVPMTVPSLVNFFVAGGVMGNKKTVAFEVFRWTEGQQKMERFEVAPGDMVGGDRNGIDYKTEWTVVDFREDPRANDPQILLVNNKDGTITARSFKTDREDRLYQALKKQVDDIKAAERAASPTAAAGGGAVPGVAGTAAAR